MKHLSILFTMLFLASFGYAKENEIDSIKTQNINEVTIFASRTQAKLKELPAKVEVITKRAISQSGAKDMTTLLKNNTSVDVIQYPNFVSGIGMRGFAPSSMSNKYVFVLIDGMPAGTMNMGTLALSGIEQVEILKGPFSSLYGSSAMGGLINIVPNRNKNEITGNVNLGYGSFNTMLGNANIGGKITKGLSFDTDFFYRKSGEYTIGNKNYYDLNSTDKAILDEKSYGSKMDNTGEKSLGGNLRLGYDFNSNWSLNVYGSLFSVKDALTNGSFFNVYNPLLKDMTRNSVRASLEGKVNRHNLKLNSYYATEWSQYYEVKDKNKSSNSTTNTYGLQLQDIIYFNNNKITLGLDNQNTDNKGESFDPKVKNKQIAPYNPDYTNNTLGAFVQADFKVLNDKVALSAGGRYDYMNLTLEANEFLKNKETSETHNIFNPNVGFKINVTPNATLHGSYGQAFLAPRAIEKAGEYTTAWGITKGNPDLKPETSTTFDLGFSYKNFQQGIAIDVTYFHTNHKDKIISSRVTTDKDNPYNTFINAGKARMNGVEIMASYDFGALVDYSFSLKAYFNATSLFDNKVKLDNGDNLWKDMKYTSKQTANFGLHFMTENKWDIKINGRYSGSRIEDNWYTWYPNVRPNLAKLAMQTQPDYAQQGLLKSPHFMVFDTHIYYNLTKNFSIGLNANNLLDENYAEKDGYNMPGRNFLAKVSYKF